MKRMFTTLSLGLILFTSCSKDPVIEPTASFTATINGQTLSFVDPITARSELNVTTGLRELSILGERKITADSSTQIRFVIPDFTLNATIQTITLNPNYARSGFVEYVNTPGSLHGSFNFFQSGQLNLSSSDKTYLSGSFNFTYFTFDKYGNKTSEVNVTNGNFTNLKITKL